MEGTQVARRKQRDEELLESMRAAAAQAADVAPAPIPDTFETRLAYEQGAISNQLIHGFDYHSESLEQKDIAHKMGVSEGRVSQILSGDQNLTIRTIASLAAATETHIRIIVEKAEEAPWEKPDGPSGLGDVGVHDRKSSSVSAGR